MKKTLWLAILSLFIFGATNAVAQVQPQSLLPGALIPKFVDPLPGAGPITVVDATSLGLPFEPGYNAAEMRGEYNIHMREFQAQILPSTGVPLANIPAGTSSAVWGYLTDGDLAAMDSNGLGTAANPRPSYLGPVVIAEKDVPAYPTYLNELPMGLDSQVFSYLPFDLTLDWANPINVDCGDEGPLLHEYTDPTCGLVPIQGGYQFPLPDSVHIHGGEVAPAYDGGPDSWFTQDGLVPGQPIATGSGFAGKTYEYLNEQQEGTIWFHPHGFGITRLNVYAGLAGVYPIIDPGGPTAPAIPMPSLTEGFDIPLIIQDRSFDTNGEIFYNVASNPQPNPTVHPFWTPEFIGDVIVVNGKTWPYLNVEPQQYRFRLLNGSNARFYDLTIPKDKKDNHPFIVIATDDGYLQQAIKTENVVIGPGERYEVIVDFSKMKPGQVFTMKNSAGTPFPFGGAPTLNGTDTVMQFRVVADNPATVDVPIIKNKAQIRKDASPIHDLNQGVTPLVVTDAVGGSTGTIVRQLTLNEVSSVDGPLELVVNNSKYNLTNYASPECATGVCRETEFPQVGTTEIWEVINITADAHPMHTHLTSFQVLERIPLKDAVGWTAAYEAMKLGNGVGDGEGPPFPYNEVNLDGAIGGNPPIYAELQMNKARQPLPYEMGWKDTAIMYPDEVTRIAVRWAPTDIAVGAETPGTSQYPFDPTELSGTGQIGYVWHCHILDHEDNEMMRPYIVKSTRQQIYLPGP